MKTIDEAYPLLPKAETDEQKTRRLQVAKEEGERRAEEKKRSELIREIAEEIG